MEIYLTSSFCAVMKNLQQNNIYVCVCVYIYIYMIYLLTAIGLTPGGSSTVHIYTQTNTEQHYETEYPEHT